MTGHPSLPLPRGPRETLLGVPWLARAVDKGRMALEGRLGDYEFPCPADAFILGLLGLSPEDFLHLLAMSNGKDLEDRLAERVATFSPRERLSLEVFCVKNSRLFDSLDQEEGRGSHPLTSFPVHPLNVSNGETP
ncbi:MAG: DUF5069 domain-containing protein [Leptospirillia bacterium]